MTVRPPRPDRYFDEGLQHERTAMAWERTAIGTMVAGTLLARYAVDDGHLPFGVFGMLQAAFGAGLLAWSGDHYDELHGPLREGQNPSHPRAAMVVGTATVLLSFGAFTWAVILGYALWRRSWRLALAGLAYFLLVLSFFVLAVRAPENEEPGALESLYFIIALGICWLLGAAHVLLLNPTVWAAVGGLFWSGRQRTDEQRRLRREQARYLLHHYPAARAELCIGRPDLLRGYDDGGLVDINAVPDPLLATLPGLTAEQCRQIAVDRWLRGPYGSLEELAQRCGLPPAAAEPLRDVLLFLPPELPPARPS